jgi:hypothetical protein
VLVDADRHGEQSHQRPGGGADGDGGEDAEPQRTRLLGGEEAAERPGIHRPLDAQVEHSGPLAEDRPEGAVRQRRGDGEHRRDHGHP